MFGGVKGKSEPADSLFYYGCVTVGTPISGDGQIPVFIMHFPPMQE